MDLGVDHPDEVCQYKCLQNNKLWLEQEHRVGNSLTNFRSPNDIGGWDEGHSCQHPNLELEFIIISVVVLKPKRFFGAIFHANNERSESTLVVRHFLLILAK